MSHRSCVAKLNKGEMLIDTDFNKFVLKIGK